MVRVAGGGGAQKKPAPKPVARVNPLTPPALMGRPSAPRPVAVAPTRPNSITQLINTYKAPGTGVGKPVSKTPLMPPSLGKPIARPGAVAGAAAGKAAGKTIAKAAPKAPTVPRNTPAPNRTGPVGGVGGGRPLGTTAPVAPVSSSSGSVQQIQSQADSLANYMSTASQAVQAELLPALNDLNRQIEEMQSRGKRDMDRTDQRGRATQSDLGELFGRLGNFTGEIQKASTANYQGLQQQTGSAYDALKTALGSTYGAQTQASTNEMNRLGIAGTAPNANDRLGRDQAFLTGLADVDKTAAVTGLGNSQNSFDQLMSMARGNAATEGAVRVGQSKRDTDRALNDIAFELETGTRNLAGKRGDIEATRGEKIRQLAEAMEEKAYGRKTEAQDRTFQQELATERFGLEKQAASAAAQPQPVAEPTLDEINRSILLQMQVEEKKAAAAQAASGQLTDADFMERLRAATKKYGNPGAGGLFAGMFQ